MTLTNPVKSFVINNVAYDVAYKPWIIHTANYAAQVGDRVVANASAAGFTVTLPANATPGDEVQLLTIGTNAIAVDPAGANLNGAIAPMQISADRQETHFIYIGAAGWVAAVGGGAASSGGGTTPTPTPTPTVDYLAEIKKVSGWQQLLMSDVGVTSSSSAVSVWADQSGLNNHASMSEEVRQPALIPNSLGGNKPSLAFSESQLIYQPITGTEKTIFIVARFATSNDSNNYLLGNLLNSSPIQLFGFDDDNLGMRLLSSSGNYFGGLKRTEVLNQWRIFELVINSSRSATLLINGVTQAGSVTIGSDFTGGLIGAFGASDFRSLEGSIAAILQNGVLSSAQRTSIRSHLAGWAGITL